MIDTFLILRHAEKPDDRSDPDLSATGRARAGRLATYIPQTFGAPDRLFAAARSNHSNRCVETITPLSATTDLPIGRNIAEDAVQDLVDALNVGGGGADRKTVVCWHHKHIPDLLAALGAPDGSYPRPWPDLVFDLIFVVRHATGQAPTIAQVKQPF